MLDTGKCNRSGGPGVLDPLPDKYVNLRADQRSDFRIQKVMYTYYVKFKADTYQSGPCFEITMLLVFIIHLFAIINHNCILVL